MARDARRRRRRRRSSAGYAVRRKLTASERLDIAIREAVAEEAKDVLGEVANEVRHLWDDVHRCLDAVEDTMRRLKPFVDKVARRKEKE